MELEDRSDDEIEDGCGDEYYTPTQSPRESTDSETQHKKKVADPRPEQYLLSIRKNVL